MQMASTMLSLVIVFSIALVAIFAVLNFGKPAIEIAKASTEARDAETVMKFVDNYMREIAAEGNGSIRQYKFIAPKEFEALKGENAIVYSSETSQSLFDFGTRTKSGNLIYIAGSDVSCAEADGNSDGVTDFVIENRFVRFVFNRTPETSPYSSIDTNYAILNMTQKNSGTSIIPSNSSIHVDGNSSSSYGNGFTEISRTGSNLPFCTVRFFVNSSSWDYDAYYRLYAGADFLTVYVRNIRQA